MRRQDSCTDPTNIGEHRGTSWWHMPKSIASPKTSWYVHFPPTRRNATAASHGVAGIAKSHSHAEHVRKLLALMLRPAGVPCGVDRNLENQLRNNLRQRDCRQDRWPAAQYAARCRILDFDVVTRIAPNFPPGYCGISKVALTADRT